MARKGKFPQWSALAAVAEPNLHLGARIAAGVELLLAWKDAREISKAATADIFAAIQDTPLFTAQLTLLLNGLAQEDDICAPWHRRLRRSWRQVVHHFAASGSTPPPQNFEDRSRGQILESSVFASPNRRAGAADHRQLSPLQMNNALTQIGIWIDAVDFRRVYGFMTCCTGLTLDLVAHIPLHSPTVQVEWIVVVDVDLNCLKMDVSVPAHEAACALDNAAIMSNFVCFNPLPKNLSDRLRARLKRFPGARRLGDLYPEAAPLDPRTPVVQCHDEIKPSWARLRRSSGTFMRNLGIDNLLALVVKLGDRIAAGHERELGV